ncbi:2Fe-2S iron-sulfur cluster binding domain-containing protein [Clostridium bovifaecis]|uniref:Ferredoxin n=1 Tax=Clostridium bovifaecis TaxID=2184719 RepID=A0A6I6ENM8_9CLOT|nr:2Fe-2S iron-sulfur cluster binding domain-containing protein [Clostridium bovifaecis]
MKVIIDGKECEANRGEYLLAVARRNGIEIPTLCHSDAIPGLGSCRLCIVEVIENGWSKVVTSCIFPITREVEVLTNSEKIKRMRKNIVMLLSAEAPNSEKIKELREEYGVPEPKRFHVDNTEKCMLCGLCAKACEELGSSAISTVDRGVNKKVSTPYDEPSAECIGCGACAFVCPTDAIDIKDSEGKRVIWGKSFEMLKCECCGKEFATKEQYEYAHKKSGEKEYSILCDKCKKKLKADQFKEIYGV